MVDNCLAGYHSTIFAYGQTGAGKTHTISGSLAAKDHDKDNLVRAHVAHALSHVDWPCHAIKLIPIKECSLSVSAQPRP